VVYFAIDPEGAAPKLQKKYQQAHFCILISVPFPSPPTNYHFESMPQLATFKNSLKDPHSCMNDVTLLHRMNITLLHCMNDVTLLGEHPWIYPIQQKNISECSNNT
jgi:hypothetical protein